MKKKKLYKQMLSMVLVITILLSMIPINTMAEALSDDPDNQTIAEEASETVIDAVYSDEQDGSGPIAYSSPMGMGILGSGSLDGLRINGGSPQTTLSAAANAINAALGNNDPVTVTGGLELTSYMNITIPENKTLVWKASLCCPKNTGLKISGAGTLQILEGGHIYAKEGEAHIEHKLIEILNGQSVKIEIDGGIVESTVTNVIPILTRGSVELKDGLVSAFNRDAIMVFGANTSIDITGGKIEVEGVSADSRGIYVNADNVEITIKGGEINAEGEYGRGIGGDKFKENTTINIKSGRINTSSVAIGVSSMNGNTVTIDGGEISSGSTTIDLDENNTLNINGGRIVSKDETTIYLRGNNSFNMSGGTVVTENDYYSAAIKIQKTGSTVNVSGGQVISYGSADMAFEFAKSDNIFNITGGLVFGCGSKIEGSYNVIRFADNPNYVANPTDDGIIIAWNKGSSQNKKYFKNDTYDIIKAPDTATAYWNKIDGESGISYESGDNKGFIPLEGVTVFKKPVNNSSITEIVNRTYDGSSIDIEALGIFTIDDNAGERVYSLEQDGATGEGIISGSSLAITKAGIFKIGLVTGETEDYDAGEMVIGILEVEKGDKDAPTSLATKDASLYKRKDGKITGLTPSTLYEYRMDGEETYDKVTSNEDGEITGLGAGSYLVRFPETDLYKASPDSESVEVKQPDIVERQIAIYNGDILVEGPFYEEQIIEIKANTIDDMIFDKWTSEDGINFDDPSKGNTSFPMVGKDVSLKANYKAFEGEGKIGSPYQISTAEELARLARLVNKDDGTIRDEFSNKYYKLMNDIDLSELEENFNDGKGWIPIGWNENGSLIEDYAFKGHFDGNNKTIENLNINNSTMYLGLFGYIKDGSVKYLTLTDVNIKVPGSGKSIIGSVAGTITDGSLLENCHALGIVDAGNNSTAGGVAGRVYSTIRACSFQGQVKGSEIIGGIAGSLSDVIENCFAAGSIQGNRYVGGLCGDIQRTPTVNLNPIIKNSYSTAEVIGDGYMSTKIGGITGRINMGSVEDSYALGSVSGANMVGGIAGEAYGDIKDSLALNPEILGSEDIGRVAGFHKDTYALADNLAFSGMEVSINGEEEDIVDGLADNINGLDKTASDLSDTNFWTDLGWDAYIWELPSDENGLPILKAFPEGIQTSEMPDYLKVKDIEDADVDVGGPYIYDGNPKVALLTVTFNGKTLKEDKDYIREISNTGLSDGTNAGEVTLELSGIGNYGGTKEISYTIEKADQETPLPPSLVSKTSTTITINEISGNVEYGRNTADTAPTDGWQAGATFENLIPNTKYYIFARFKENDNYKPSPASDSISDTTKKAKLGGTVTLEGAGKFEQIMTVNIDNLKTDVDAYDNFGTIYYQWYKGLDSASYEKIDGENLAAYTLTQEDIGYYINVEVSSSSCEGSIWGEGTKTEKADGPEAPIVTGSYTGDGTYFTYTIDPIDGAEYSMPDDEWQDDNVFGSFTTESLVINFYARIKETQTHEAGQAGNTGEVEFTKLGDRPTPKLTYTISETDFPKIITIEEVAGGEYSFDGTNWSDTNTYTSESEENLTPCIRLKENATHFASAYSSTEINTAYKNQNAPVAFTLSYESIDDESYTVTIPITEGAEYKFEGEEWSSENTKSGLKTNESITGYKRIAAKPGYNPSPSVSATVTLPLFKVKTPTATPNGGSFAGSQSVTLKSATTNADIYYTLDEKEPTSKSTKYTEAIKLTASTTIKAIAVKEGMTDSDILAVSFTKHSSGGKDKDKDKGSGGSSSTAKTPVQEGNEGEGNEGEGKEEKEQEDKNPSTTDINNFSDVGSNWARDDISYVLSRGLFNGTSQSTFSPRTNMTRGMFVTVLGRLAGVNISSYKKSSFADVNADAYYMGFVEWASQNDIVKGVGNNNFAPDRPINREQMAVIIFNYIKATGIVLPEVNEASFFSDNDKISDYAKEAILAMQRAGILMGKGENSFDPQGTATRAEVAAVIRRLAEALTTK